MRVSGALCHEYEINMSWDVSIVKFSKSYNSIEEIPADEKPLDLGTKTFVQNAVLEFFPTTDRSDPSWGIFDSKFGSIEFNIGKENPTSSMMLHVRASEEIVEPIVMLCKKNNWSGLDCSTGDFLEKSECPTSGLSGWRKYLAQVLNEQKA